MGNLAYRSSKLGFKSSALAYNSPWVKMTKSAAQYKTGQYGWQTNTYGFTLNGIGYMDGWDPYPGGNFDMVDRVLDIYDAASWTAGDAVARLTAAHSHGLQFTGYSMKGENFFLYQEGLALFGRPSGYPTITEARLWLGNAGEIFHTIQDRGGNTWVTTFDGLFGDPCGYGNSSLAFLDNTWLEIVISASSSVYHVIKLTRGDLATLNVQQGNGKIVAGLGSYSYMYSSSIFLTLPSAVLSMLNNYTGVSVDIFWNWDNAIVGPACNYCLHTAYCSTHGPSYSDQVYTAASPWATRTGLARLLDLEVR